MTNNDCVHKYSKNRMRLLAVLNILNECCYNRQAIPLDKIVKKLDFEYELDVERKAVLRDIQSIKAITDYNIEYDKKQKGYAVENNEALNIEDMEIIKKALIAGKFISTEETKNILEKIKKGSSKKVRMEDSIKFTNREFRKNVQLINEAIRENKKIKFDYMKIDNKMNEYVEREGCIVSPYELVWFEDLYYLLGNYKDNLISHYRIDRIKNLEVLKVNRLSINRITHKFDEFNSLEYIRKVAGMSSGVNKDVKLKVQKEYIGKVRDKFGDKVTNSIVNENETIIFLEVIYSKEFVSWILSFGDGIQVLWPKAIKDEIKEKIEKMMKIYNLCKK